MSPAQAAAGSSSDLRPLPLGELLDRAFHLYFKHFALFIALLAVVLVPYTIMGYFQSKDALDAMLSLFTQTMHAPGTTQPSQAELEKLSRLNGLNGWFGVQMAIVFLLLPLANAAVVVAVSRTYLGLNASFAASYRAATQRWFPILLLIVLWVVIAGLAFAGLLVLVFIAAAIMGVLATALHGSTFIAILTAIFLIVLTLAMIALAVMLYLTVAFSFVAIVLERVDPVRAFTSAFKRVFAPRQTGRSVLLALSLFAIQLGFTFMGYAVGGLLAYFLKSAALYFVAASLIQLLYAPFALLAIAVFYYDVRIRHEGFDLQLLAEQMASPAATLPSAPA